MTVHPSTSTDSLQPATARRVRFLELLGQGGFGAVYRAEISTESGLLQHVAIKVLSSDMTAHADLAARQRDEARLLSRLRHHAIVTVFDLTELGGRPAVVMELVEGVDASDLREAGVLTPRSALQIIAETAGALDAAWSSPDPETGRPLRVVHRDIKPANLLISRHGGVKVLDFGVARADFDREGITGSVQFGTARYMAPEQWMSGTASHPVDIYALGVSLVELLTGAPLSRAPLQAERFAAHLEAAAEAAGGAARSAAVTQLVRDMLAYDAEARPAAAEVRDRALTLADVAPGTQLARLAPEVVPGQMDARRTRLAGRALPGSLPLGAGQDATPPTIDPAAPPTLPPHLRDARSVSPDTPSERHRNHQPSDSRYTLELSLPAFPGGEPPSAPPAHRTRWGLAAGALGVLMLGLVGAGTTWRSRSSPGTSPAAGPAPVAAPAMVEMPEADAAPDAGEPVSDEAPPLTADATAESIPARSRSTDARRPAPHSRAAAPPAPAPSSNSPREGVKPDASPEPPTAAPAPEPATPRFPVTLTSDPLGARVWVDGEELGTTPIVDSPLSEGNHALRMELGSATTEGTVRIRRMRVLSVVKWDVSADRLSMQ